jgi:hypothetical protein
MDVYNWLITHFGVSALDALLLGILFWLAKARYQETLMMLECHTRRMERVEKSCLKAGIILLELEE